MADFGSGGEYPREPADHGGGGEYRRGVDHGGGDQHSGGSDHKDGNGYSSYDHGSGSRPASAGKYGGDIEEPAALATAFDEPMSPGLNEGRVVSISCLKYLLLDAVKRLPYTPFLNIPFILVWIFIAGNTSALALASLRNDYTKPFRDGRRNLIVKSKKPVLKVKVHKLTIVMLVRVGCMTFIWMVINLSVPTLERIPFLGSQFWKWSLLATLMLLGYPIFLVLYLSTYKIFQLSFKTFRGSNVEYCLDGLAQSAVLVQYFTAILIVWMLFVDTSNATLHRYVSMTIASFLAGAVLSVVKSAVLLWWKTKLIYRKYEGRILLAGCQLYFHILLVDGRGERRQLVEWGEPMGYELKSSSAKKTNNEETRVEDQNGEATTKKRKILPSEKYMLRKRVSLEYVHEIATCLAHIFKYSLTEDRDIPDIAPILLRNFEGSRFSINGDLMNRYLETFGITLLQDLLKEEEKKDPTYKEFEKWMVDGFMNCYSVVNRINGAMEAMRLLNRVLTGLIVLVVVLIWIFMTGFATTSVVVGLASMFLGLSFVFGDTCKTFFQGVVFSFVTHPFDVGDRCIIDDKEMKVKKINILTTTFFGSQSREVVIHPNSDLCNKQIVVLLHGEQASESKPKLHGIVRPQMMEPEDVIELILPCSTKAHHIESLQTKIERYLEDGVESGIYKESYWVTFNETAEGIKMGVHFYHNLNIGGEGEQPKTLAIGKEKQRSKFFLQLRALQENNEESI